jgi:hypothetical protein
MGEVFMLNLCFFIYKFFRKGFENHTKKQMSEQLEQLRALATKKVEEGQRGAKVAEELKKRTNNPRILSFPPTFLFLTFYLPQ